MIRKFMCLILLVLVGCVSVTSRWNEAQQTNTVSSYEAFIKEYPDTEYSSHAKQRVEKLKQEIRIQRLAEVRQAGTVAKYEEYLKLYPQGADSDLLRTDLQVLREWEPRKCLGELITSLCPVMVVRSSGGGLNFTGTATGEYINFMGQGATLEPQAKEQDVIPRIDQLLKAGVDPNTIRISGFVSSSRTPMGGFAEKISSGSPGVVVPAEKEGMTLLEYCTTNKFDMVADLLKTYNAK